MTYDEIIKELKSHSNPKNIEGMARFGIRGKNVLGGPSIPILRKMSKQIRKQETSIHKLALNLWDSEIHEARILAGFIDDPALITEKQMETWVKGFDSWDLCDQVCCNLFDKMPISYQKAIEWSKRPEEFAKRAAFALMAGLAWHDKSASDEKFTQFFPNIVEASTDERNFVKKAVNWALRQIGKRNSNLKKQAIKTAEDILASHPESKSARWIANDALRELKNK